jgi:hypothetical protein
MNEFDKYVKHELKQRFYIRYADDFVIMHRDREVLMGILPKIRRFLEEKLRLTLHPDKVFIKTLASGIDFLGWVHFSDHSVLRTTTKKRMLKKLENKNMPETLQSYLGLLSYGNAKKLKKLIKTDLF